MLVSLHFKGAAFEYCALLRVKLDGGGIVCYLLGFYWVNCNIENC